MKLVMCAAIAELHVNLSFVKPFKPILGETLEANYSDGTKIFAEEINDHPPASYYFIKGPSNLYTASG